MDDIRGVIRCPSALQDYIARIGGPAGFGKPMWRLVFAASVIWKVAGGKVWDESLSASERGGFVEGDIDSNGLNLTQSPNKPIRDEYGTLIERRRYPHLDGWILQKWFPPTMYSQSQWYAPENCMPDGTPKLGPYPQFGDYEMIGGCVQRIPSRQEVYDVISCYDRSLATRPASLEQRIIQSRNAIEIEMQQEQQRARNLTFEYMSDACSYLKSSSLEAGRIRTERAEKLGIREHVGN